MKGQQVDDWLRAEEPEFDYQQGEDPDLEYFYRPAF
jgi:hypothetical protein